MKQEKIISACGEKQPFIIAEVGNNHEGDFGLAQELVHAAATAGADAVKFQTIDPLKIVSSDQVERIAQLGRFRFSFGEFAELSNLADNLGILFFSTPFDLQAVDKLDPIQRIFKVSSGDNTYTDLVSKVAQKGKQTLISTGGMSQSDIKKLDKLFSSHAVPGAELILLHCISLYPTAAEDAELWRIKWLIDNFPDSIIGYSDHTLGLEACKIAVALGARVLEKHFTLDKKQSDFRDHQLSADPEEMEQLVRDCRNVKTFIGEETASKRPDSYMIGMRRAAVAARDIPQGNLLSAEDVSWLRSIDQHAIFDATQVLGKVILKDLTVGQIIKTKHFIKD